jgi:hypothetical protein
MNDNPMRDVIEQMKAAAQREGKQQTSLQAKAAMELNRIDIEMIISQLLIAGMEQERIAEKVRVPDGYLEMAQYFRDLSARMKAFCDGSSAEKFVLREGE